MNIRHIQETLQSLPPCFGSMTCHILTGGNPGRLWYSVSLKEMVEGFYAAFNLYGGIEGFREIIKELPSLSPRDMNFVCIVFNLEKEELKCYTRKLSREKHLNS